MNNDKWKEFDEFKNIAEFRGFTKASLDNIQRTLSTMTSKFDNVHGRIDENDNCIANNSIEIGKLQMNLRNIEYNARKKGGMTGGITAGIISVIAHIIQSIAR